MGSAYPSTSDRHYARATDRADAGGYARSRAVAETVYAARNRHSPYPRSGRPVREIQASGGTWVTFSGAGSLYDKVLVNVLVNGYVP